MLRKTFFFFINTGKYWLCSVCRNIFQEMESMQWACECFSSHTFSISFFCFVFKVSGFFLSQYIHRLKSHSRLKKKKTLLQTTNSERVRKETLVGSCVSSPVSTLKLVRGKKNKKQLSMYFFSPRAREMGRLTKICFGSLQQVHAHIKCVKTRTSKKKKKKEKVKNNPKNILEIPFLGQYLVHLAFMKRFDFVSRFTCLLCCNVRDEKEFSASWTQTGDVNIHEFRWLITYMDESCY